MAPTLEHPSRLSESILRRGLSMPFFFAPEHPESTHPPIRVPQHSESLLGPSRRKEEPSSEFLPDVYDFRKEFKMARPKIFRKPVNHWAARSKILSLMGLSSYESYLQTELWSLIRMSVMMRDKWKCRCCKSHATDVHHRTYSKRVLTGQDLRQLYSLCHPCHELVTFDREGKYRSQDSSIKELERMLIPIKKK